MDSFSGATLGNSGSNGPVSNAKKTLAEVKSEPLGAGEKVLAILKRKLDDRC